MQTYDVVIVGAGLGGLQCARLVAPAGLRVLLVDRKQHLGESVHTTGIFVRRTLDDFALPEAFLGPPIRHVSLFSPDRNRIDLESGSDEFRVGKMAGLYRHFLDEAVTGGVEWWPATRYRGRRAVAGGSLVQLSREGTDVEVATRLLVAADGAVSSVARDLHLDENREWIVGLEEVLTGVPLEGPPRFLLFLDTELAPGYLAWVVNDGEEAHIGVGGYAKRYNAPQALDTFRAIAGQAADLDRGTVVERRGGRIPVGGVLRRIAGPDGLAVGDAAGAVSPLTAGGLDPCIRLSALAADVIVDALVVGNPEALDRYDGARFRSQFTTRIWLRRLLSAMRSRPLMEMSHVVLRLPVVRGFAERVFFGSGSFPDVEIRHVQPFGR